MAKKPFTTRIDGEVMELAARLAAAERRSVTSVFEIALLEYANRRRLTPDAEPLTPIKAEDVR